MSKSKLRRSISRWANPGLQEVEDLRLEHTGVVRAGVESRSIAEASDRERVVLRGSLRTVTLRPRAGVPALEAELDDGTGVITIVWLGRRQIAGIDPGRSISVEGRVGTNNGVRVIYNPRYELLP